MSSRCLRLSLSAVLSLSFAVAACDRPNDITSPSSNAVVAVPQYSHGDSDNGNSGKGNRSTKPSPVVVSARASESNICRIGRNGGFCAVPGAMIVVPANAVNKDTYFQINLNVGPHVVLALSASSKECRKNCSDDVGSAGFKKPVTLVVSKFGAKSSSLVLLSNSNEVVLTHDLGGFITAEVLHFTEFTMAE